jgi:uncharacterized protein (DUF2336 family)
MALAGVLGWAAGVQAAWEGMQAGEGEGEGYGDGKVRLEAEEGERHAEDEVQRLTADVAGSLRVSGVDDDTAPAPADADKAAASTSVPAPPSSRSDGGPGGADDVPEAKEGT